MSTHLEQNNSNKADTDVSHIDNPTISGSIYITFLLLIGTSFLQFIFIIPLLINGMLTLEMFNLSQSEFGKAVGLHGESLLLLAELAALIICIKIAFKSKNIPLNTLGFKLKGYKVDALIGAFIGIVVIATCFGLLTSTGYITFTVQKFTLVPWLASCSLFLLVAIVEEVLCRGFIQNLLMRATSPYVALIISSIIFMALHLGNDNWTLISLLNLALAGVTFGLYYLHTKNLWFPIALHFTWNFFQGPVFGFEVSGHKMESWIAITRTNNSLITGGEFGLEGSILVTVFEILMITLIHFKFTCSQINPNNKKMLPPLSPS